MEVAHHFFFFTISRTITSVSLSIFVLHEAGELHHTHSVMSPSVATSFSTLLQEADSQDVPVSAARRWKCFVMFTGLLVSLSSTLSSDMKFSSTIL